MVTTPKTAFSARQRFLIAIVPPVVTLLLRLLCRTLGFETQALAGAQPADVTPGPDIYAFWHRCLLLAAYRYRHLGIRILISQSFDGELIARIVQRLGFVPVRGSSSRGAAGGLLGLSRSLAQGHKIAITVDGPRGPNFVAKAGAAAAALHAGKELAKRNPEHLSTDYGVGISPFYLYASKCWTLRSWDRLVIPKPWARVTCVWMTPVAAGSTDNVDEVTARLQTALDQAVALSHPA